jgi:hypothetical protein
MILLRNENIPNMVRTTKEQVYSALLTNKPGKTTHIPVYHKTKHTKPIYHGKRNGNYMPLFSCTYTFLKPFDKTKMNQSIDMAHLRHHLQQSQE